MQHCEFLANGQGIEIQNLKRKKYFVILYRQVDHVSGISIPSIQKQPPEVFCKNRCSVRIGALRNFAKFTGKHLCQSLFFFFLDNYFHRKFYAIPLSTL